MGIARRRATTEASSDLPKEEECSQALCRYHPDRQLFRRHPLQTPVLVPDTFGEFRGAGKVYKAMAKVRENAQARSN